MRQEDLQELQYITPIANVPSMLQHGILSHKRSARVQHDTVAMEQVQRRRKVKSVPRGRSLHEYANLYINARNKMMYRIKTNRGVDQLCVLRISTDILDLDDVVIADQNASSSHVRFSQSPDGLKLIDKDIVFAESWVHPDNPIEEMRHGSVVCAEALVPDFVAPKYINGAYVPTAQTKTELREIAPSLSIAVNGHLFFL